MTEPKIELADVVRELRKELRQAIEDGEGEDLRFRITDLELELQVGVTKSVSGKGTTGGGIKFWVLNADSKAEIGGEIESTRLQKIKLKLEPHHVDPETGRDGGSISLGRRG